MSYWSYQGSIYFLCSGKRKNKSDTKNPLNGGFFFYSCLLFASRYSFAKHTGIEAVCGQKCNSFFH